MPDGLRLPPDGGLLQREVPEPVRRAGQLRRGRHLHPGPAQTHVLLPAPHHRQPQGEIGENSLCCRVLYSDTEYPIIQGRLGFPLSHY